MRKTIMKLVSFLCCICLLIGYLPMKTYATDSTGSTGNEVIITCNDSTKVTVGGSWNTTKWSAVKPTDEQYLAGVEGIFGDDDLTYRTAKKYWIKFDLSAYSGDKYNLYFLNLNTGTVANADSGLSTGTFSFRNGDTVVANTEFDPLANDNGAWITVGTYELGSESTLYIQNLNQVKNFRVAAIKLVPVTEEPTEPSEPSEESSQPSSEPSEESSQLSSEPSEESSQLSSEPSEESSQPSSEPSEESSQPSSEPSEESSQPSSEPSEESSQLSSEPSEESSQPSSEPSEPTSTSIIINCNDPIVTHTSAWKPVKWEDIKPASYPEDFVLANDANTYFITNNSGNAQYKFFATGELDERITAGTYELYVLNVNTETEAKAGKDPIAKIHFRDANNKAVQDTVDFKPLEEDNGKWVYAGNFEIAQDKVQVLMVQNAGQMTNFRNVAIKLVPVEVALEPEPSEEIIIPCDKATYTLSWSTSSSLKGPTGTNSRYSKVKNATATYDLSEYIGTYDLYFYNCNYNATQTNASVKIVCADSEIVAGSYDPLSFNNNEWICYGTYEFDEESYLTLINTSNMLLRNVAIKLVPNTSGTAATPQITIKPYEETWRTLAPDSYIILSAVDDGYSMSAGWKTSSTVYPSGTGCYSGTVGAWAMWKPNITQAEGITLWYLVDGAAGTSEDSALRLEIYAEGKITTKIIDFASGESRWEELGTFNFDGSGNEYIKVIKQESSKGTTSRVTNLRIGYKNAVNDKNEEETIESVYTGTDMEILQRIGLLTGTEEGITEAYVQSVPTSTDLEVMKLKMNGLFEEAANYEGTNEPVVASDYAKMLLEQMGYVYGTDFDMDNIHSYAKEAGIDYDTQRTFTIDMLADMTVQALEADMKSEKRSLLGSVMNKMEPISDATYNNPSVFTETMREAREEAKNKERTLIYNNDGNDTYRSYAEYPGPFDTSTVTEPKTHANFLSKRTTGLETSQVDSVFYGTGVYNSYHHNSAIADLRQRDWSPELFKIGETLADGTVDKRDSIQTVLDWCKDNNREFMWSMRMNDTHDYTYETEYLDSFKRENPQYLVSSRETAVFDLVLAERRWSAVDYAELGVRQRSYDLLREVILNYDVDGIELDFSRHSIYFEQVVTKGEDANAENLERMNNFMRSLRTLTEQVSAEKGKPILIAIHVADSMGFCKSIGLDVEQWMEEDLVDIVSIRTYGAYQSMEDGLAEYEEYDVPVYLIIDSNNSNASGFDYSKEAAKAYKAGYTGIQLYNEFDPTDKLYWTLGDESTVTYDPEYAELTRVSSDNSYGYNAKNRFVTYRKAAQTISFAESTISKTMGDEKFVITANGSAEGSTITYSSSNNRVATVDEATGEVTICGLGRARIIATSTATGAYNEATATYTLTVLEKQPEPLEILTAGTAESYQHKSNAVTAIHCSGELAELESVKMDGTVVDASNYDLVEGSTIVTFKTAYLDSLSEGEHTVTLCYSDNRSIDSKLTIKAADTPKVEEDDDDDDTGYVEDATNDSTAADESVADAASGSVSASAAPTGDNSNMGLWILLLVAAVAVYGALLTVNKKR